MDLWWTCVIYSLIFMLFHWGNHKIENISFVIFYSTIVIFLCHDIDNDVNTYQW